MYVRLSLIFIWLNLFVILSPYNSAYPSIVDYPINISETTGNIIIEQYSSNPQIATLREKVYTVWEEDNGELVEIYFRRSPDGGASFDKTINLSNTTGEARNPHIDVSGNTVYVTWLQIIGDTISIYFKKSPDGGASFDKTINLSNITASPRPALDDIISRELDSIIRDTRYPSIVAAGSNVYVVWLDNVKKTSIQSLHSKSNNSTNSTISLSEYSPIYDLVNAFPWEEEVGYSDVFYKRSTDGGASFDKTINLTYNITLTQNPQLTVAGSNLYLVWNGGEGLDSIYFRRSTDGGASFEPVANLVSNSDSNIGWLDNPQVYASDANVYIIYQQEYDFLPSLPEERKKSKLFFTASNNTGTTFSEPIILGDNLGRAQIYQSGSNVYAVWAASGYLSDIIFRRSTDGGASFEPVVKLSENITKGSFIPKIIANGSILYIAWAGEANEFLARSRDGGSEFDISINTTGSNPSLSMSEGNATLLWTEDGEIFFRKVSPTLPLSSVQHSKIQSPIVIDQTPIVIDGLIGSMEWGRIPSSSLEQLNGRDDSSELGTIIRSDAAQLNNKMYQVELASTYNNNNSYFVLGVQGVQGTDFKGGSNITLMFDDNDNGKIDNGDDILRITGRVNSTSISDGFEDSFWNNVTNDVQKDEDYVGKEDGYAASSFYAGTEVFEISHPLCSYDINHDYCITPDDSIGFALKLEINGSSTLLFFNKEDNQMSALSLTRGGVYGYDHCLPPSCQGGIVASELIPPATFILQPFQRLPEYERAELLGNLTTEEQTELLTSPTFEEAQDFLLNKISAEKLGDFLLNKLEDSELTVLFNEISKIDDILNRLSEEDRKTVSNYIIND